MSRARVAVLQIVSKQLTVTAAAAEYGISRLHLHRVLARYREGGLDALEPRSRRPKTTPIATPVEVRGRVVELRAQLSADGLDAGPETIRWHLEREGLGAPSTSTIRRILHAAGLVTPAPRKRPRSSYTRFEMAQPNEMWQSDFIHYVLPLPGVRQKNGSPGHPQTQGKTERFHQTLQRWLRARSQARTAAELQRQLDEFQAHYNERRPHRALQRVTPGHAYRATPKAAPAGNGRAQGHYRLRYDRLDGKGKVTIRRAGRMHHLHAGVEHVRKRVLAFADEHQVTVADHHR
jgi:transposase InsO family protein